MIFSILLLFRGQYVSEYLNTLGVYLRKITSSSNNNNKINNSSLIMVNS